MTAPKATLKPYLEEIRQWVVQGRTDVWIAHALNSTPASISAFRSSHGILRRELASEGGGVDVPPPVAPPDAPPEEQPAKPRRRSRSKKTPEPLATSAATVAAAAVEQPPASPQEPATSSKRRRRGGRGRTKRREGFEATLDTGQEGYGFWLDGAVRDDPVFAEHWASRRGLVVRIEVDQIVIRPDDRA